MIPVPIAWSDAFWASRDMRTEIDDARLQARLCGISEQFELALAYEYERSKGVLPPPLRPKKIFQVLIMSLGNATPLAAPEWQAPPTDRS